MLSVFPSNAYVEDGRAMEEGGRKTAIAWKLLCKKEALIRGFKKYFNLSLIYVITLEERRSKTFSY